MKAWVGAALPRPKRQIGTWIEKEFGLVYESHSEFVLTVWRHRALAIYLTSMWRSVADLRGRRRTF